MISDPRLPAGEPERERRPAGFWLVGILIVSVALRVLLAARGGGELYFSDEARYVASRSAAASLAHGHLRAALDALFSRADHLFFKVLGVVPALIELPFGWAPVIAAVYFGLFSVLIIALVWKLALALGAPPVEALLSAAALACCSTYIFYTRHLYPYDPGMAFALLGFLFALRPKKRDQFLAGVFAGLAFVTYNGYWQTAGAFLVCAAWVHRVSVGSLLRYGALGLLGIATPILVILGIGRALGHDLIAAYIQFSKTTLVGDFGTTWKLTLGYYWQAEHLLSLLWVGALVWALIALVRGSLETWARFVLAILAVVLVALYVPSDLLRKIVVLGRHTRAIPLVGSLLVGWAAGRLARQGTAGRLASILLGGVILVNLAQDLRLPLSLEFPHVFDARAQAFIAKAIARDGGRYRVVNSKWLNSPTDVSPLPVNARVLVNVPHFLEYRPYLYDAWNNEARVQFLSRPLTMSIVELRSEAPKGMPQLPECPGRWRPYPGAVHMELYLDSLMTGVGYPLVSSGRKGAGDSVYVVRIDDTHVQLGYDVWDRFNTRSSPLECDPAKPHSIEISFGALYPQQERFPADPLLRLMKRRIHVRFDGQEAINAPAQSWPSAPEAIRYFRNDIGMSSSSAEFPGRVLTVYSLEQGPALPSEPMGAEAGYPGAVRLRVGFASLQAGTGYPLVCSGKPGAGEAVYVVRIDENHLRFGYDNWGRNATVSGPIACNLTTLHSVDVSFGALYAPPTASSDPSQRKASHRMQVQLDGVAVFEMPADSWPSTPESIWYLENPIGLSTSVPDFAGAVLSITRAPPLP